MKNRQAAIMLMPATQSRGLNWCPYWYHPRCIDFHRFCTRLLSSIFAFMARRQLRKDALSPVLCVLEWFTRHFTMSQNSGTRRTPRLLHAEKESILLEIRCLLLSH